MPWGLSELKPSALALLSAGPAVLLAALVLAGRLRTPWRGLARGLALFLLLRIVLLENPWAWAFYERTLRAREVGWRQMSVIREEHRSYYPTPTGVRFLAVGSSQTDAIFERFAEERDDLRVFSMAGLFPLDYVLYADRIAEYHPRVVILYLSEFDLARLHEPERIVLAPPQGLRLLRLARTLATLPGGERYRHALVEMAFGQILPEFRFAFVFRGLLRRAEGRDRFEATTRPEVDAPAEADDLRGSMEVEQIDFNLPFLRAFLAATASWGSRVVILEGRYAPAVTTEATRRLNAVVVERLRALATEFPHVAFVPRDGQPAVADADWVDAAHVSRDAGRAFAEEMLRRLEETDGAR